MKCQQAASLRHKITKAISDAHVANFYRQQHGRKPKTIFLVLDEDQTNVELIQQDQLDKTDPDVANRIVGTVDGTDHNLNPLGRNIMRLGLKLGGKPTDERRTTTLRRMR